MRPTDWNGSTAAEPDSVMGLTHPQLTRASPIPWAPSHRQSLNPAGRALWFTASPKLTPLMCTQVRSNRSGTVLGALLLPTLLQTNPFYHPALFQHLEHIVAKLLALRSRDRPSPGTDPATLSSPHRNTLSKGGLENSPPNC